MKKIFLFITILIALYAVVWIAVYIGCKLGIGALEPCIWNVKQYGFPLPKCVCVG